MGAGMPAENGLHAMLSHLAARAFIAQQVPDQGLHFFSIFCDQEILPGFEQLLVVAPGRAQQRNAAGQGFKHANRGNAGKTIGVGLPRDMQSHRAFRIDFRRKKVRKITAILNSSLLKTEQRILRIAHAVGHEVFLRHSGSGTQQEFLILPLSFFIAPVPYPDHIDLPGPFHGFELLDVRRLMKGPYAPDPETIEIEPADGLAKGEYAIEQMKLKPKYLSGTAVSTMMSVMQQRFKAVFRLERQNAVHHQGLVPFVDEDNICVLQLLFQKLLKVFLRIVKTNIEFGIGMAERINGLDGPFAFLADKIGQRPGAQLFITPGLMAHADKLAHESAQKMRVSVVPVGNKRMTKKCDAELLLHRVNEGIRAIAR